MSTSLHQFIKFCLVGGLNTVIDFGVYLLLTRTTGWLADWVVPAAMISMACATINSYLWNAFWTFRTTRTDHGVMVTKFLAVSLAGFILYTFLFSSLVQFGMYDILAKVLLTGFLVVWNFVGNKWWVYTVR